MEKEAAEAVEEDIVQSSMLDTCIEQVREQEVRYQVAYAALKEALSILAKVRRGHHLTSPDVELLRDLDA